MTIFLAIQGAASVTNSVSRQYLSPIVKAIDKYPLLHFGFDLAVAVIIAVVTVFAARLAAGALRRSSQHGGLPVNASILLGRSLEVGLWVVGFIIILLVFGLGLSPLAAFIGVFGLAAGLALQQLLQNLVAGVYLLAERPFHLGDVIVFAGDNGVIHRGSVEAIEMRVTHVRGENQELVLVPNTYLFSRVVTDKTAAGGYVGEFFLTMPRAINPDAARQQVFPLLPKSPPGVPTPTLEIDSVNDQTWSATVSYWMSADTTVSRVLWAVAQAVPSATLSLSGT
ncbi:MAG: mechanosensitive ion channel family protein [Chloroflexota bacterium]